MSNELNTILEVDGMTCASCVGHVSAALTEVGGVARVEVKLREGIVVVDHDAELAPIDRLIDALRGAGYASTVKADTKLNRHESSCCCPPPQGALNAR